MLALNSICSSIFISIIEKNTKVSKESNGIHIERDSKETYLKLPISGKWCVIDVKWN